MVYTLNQSEIYQLQIFKDHLDESYSEEIAKRLRIIIARVIFSKSINDKDLQEFLNLLPMAKSKKRILRDDELPDDRQVKACSEYGDKQKMPHEDKVAKLHHALFQWILLQNTVYFNYSWEDRRGLSHSDNAYSLSF